MPISLVLPAHFLPLEICLLDTLTHVQSHTHVLTPFLCHILESLSPLPVLTHQWQFTIWTRPKHHLPPSHTFSLCVFFLSSVQSLSRVWLFATPWTAVRQASLSITNSRTLLKLMTIESVMPSNHLILCRLLLPPSIFPSIRVFFSKSVLLIRWPKYWSFSFSISPCNEYLGLISFRIHWFDLLAVQGTLRVFSNTAVQKHQFFSSQLSSGSNSYIHMWLLVKP